MRRIEWFAIVLFSWTLMAAPPASAEESDVMLVGIPNAVRIGDGILGGGQPDEIALRQAAEAGYRTIVNLRGAGENTGIEDEAALVRSLGMDYVSLPITGGDSFNEANVKRLVEILAGKSARPAMVHCASGNRVGVLFAVKAFLIDGLDADAALKFGEASGARRIPERVSALFAGADDD